MVWLRKLYLVERPRVFTTGYLVLEFKHGLLRPWERQ